MPQTAARTLSCIDCRQSFIFGTREQEFFAENLWCDPVRCLACRRAKRERRLEDDALRERSTR